MMTESLFVLPARVAREKRAELKPCIIHAFRNAGEIFNQQVFPIGDALGYLPLVTNSVHITHALNYQAKALAGYEYHTLDEHVLPGLFAAIILSEIALANHPQKDEIKLPGAKSLQSLILTSYAYHDAALGKLDPDTNEYYSNHEERSYTMLEDFNRRLGPLHPDYLNEQELAFCRQLIISTQMKDRKKGTTGRLSEGSDEALVLGTNVMFAADFFHLLTDDFHGKSLQRLITEIGVGRPGKADIDREFLRAFAMQDKYVLFDLLAWIDRNQHFFPDNDSYEKVIKRLVTRFEERFCSRDPVEGTLALGRCYINVNPSAHRIDLLYNSNVNENGRFHLEELETTSLTGLPTVDLLAVKSVLQKYNGRVKCV